MKKVLIVFGTRPEAIKMAPVVKAFKDCNNFESKVCVTAQHREMLDQVLEFFNIIPDYDLDLMKPNQNLYNLTGEIINNLKLVLEEFAPDFVFVHGDTTTTMAASIAAFYYGAKVCHVEAGLRTFNKYAPFPEEINRSITGRIADFHFAPTDQSKQNLLNESISKEGIIVTGNTVIDALLDGVEKVKNIDLIAPLPYEAFLWLMEKSKLIITDSGGVQEEAPSLGKPVLVMRDTTERPEAVEAGTVILVGTNVEKIVGEANALLQDSEKYETMSKLHNPYGDGKASKRIVEFLSKK